MLTQHIKPLAWDQQKGPECIKLVQWLNWRIPKSLCLNLCKLQASPTFAGAGSAKCSILLGVCRARDPPWSHREVTTLMRIFPARKEGRTSTTNCEFYSAGNAGATSQSFTFMGINTELLCNRLGESKKGQHPVQPLHRADTGPRERTREK